jgi:glycosyltransferase involved in cell wall biosynthesis
LRKVLFVAYYFPPIGGSGIPRSVKFVKYLPECGWMPYVISSDPKPGSATIDPSLLDDIPEKVDVWRIPSPRPMPLMRLRQLLPSRLAATQTTESLPRRDGVRGHSRARAAVWRLLGWPLQMIEHPPIDDQLYWSLRIVPLAWKLISEHKIDLIYTSSAPYSTLLTGRLLQQLSGCPWVADFRDPWTLNPLAYRHTGFRRTMDQTLEKQALAAANKVVVVNHFMLKSYGRMLEGDPKFTLITNGFDREDIASANFRQRMADEKTVLAHFGTASPQALNALVEALMRLRFSESSNFKVQCIKVRLFGSWMNPAHREIVTSSKVADLFELHDFVSYREVMDQMVQSDVLLLFLDASRYWATVHRGKVFEYIASGVPILAIAPEGVAVELIRRSGTGCAVHPADVDGLVSILEEISSDYQRFKCQCYDPQPNLVQEYERRLLTRRLANVFDSVLMERSRL